MLSVSFAAAAALVTPLAPAHAPQRAPIVTMVDPITTAAAVAALSAPAKAAAAGGVAAAYAGVTDATGVVRRWRTAGDDAVPSWYDAGLRLTEAETTAVAAEKATAEVAAKAPPTPRTTMVVASAVESAPPAGFEWGGAFVFDGDVAVLAAPPVAAPAPAAAPAAPAPAAAAAPAAAGGMAVTQALAFMGSEALAEVPLADKVAFLQSQGVPAKVIEDAVCVSPLDRFGPVQGHP